MSAPEGQTGGDIGKPVRSVSRLRPLGKILIALAAILALILAFNILNNVFGWLDIRPF